MLAAMGMIENQLRLPLVPVEPATEQAILAAARGLGIEAGLPGASGATPARA
jgi:dihydrodipicolinate synthase/N-acetylneuraminate lyase